MGKKYTTDEIEVGGHMLDASMMTTLNTVTSNHSNYLTSLPSHSHSWSSITGKPSTFAPSSHNHDSSYLSLSGGDISGGLTISGSLSRGNYTTASQYHTGADNIVLKGNSSGISGIFFESEKDGTNINHPSDFGFIQFHSYGTSTSGEANELIIGVSNDSSDHVVLNAPYSEGFIVRVGSSATDYKIYHEGHKPTASEIGAAASSHNHDDRYYTESEMRNFFNRGYISSHSASNLPVGWYTIATNTGDRALAEFQIWDTASSDHQSVLFNASHHYGQDSSNDITVLANSRYSGTNFRHIRIKEGGTYDGAALQVYIDGSSNSVYVAITGANAQSSGWVIKDWVADTTDPGDVSWSSLTVKCQVDLDQIIQGGIVTTGDIYSGGSTTQYRVFNDNYHPNADTLTTARTIAGSSFNGSANIDINYNNLTNKPTIPTNNNQLTNGAGYTTNVGDITEVIAGTGLTGGGTSGAVTLNAIGGDGITANANNLAVDGTVARKYVGTATGINNTAYKTAFTVNGGNLSSHIRFTVQGTTGSVVVSNLIDLAVNHHQDIQIKALSGNYTLLSVKVISNNNEDFEVQLKTNSANSATLHLEVFPLGSETVTFTSTSSFTGATGVFDDIPYGNYMSGTGGDEGDLFIGGNLTVENGNVGIGTTSPSSKLHVTGEITAEDQINFKAGGSLLKLTKDSWTTATHDLIFQGWDATVDDFIYLKSPGNSTTNHGIALIGDGVIAFGRTNTETGAPELTSAAVPLNDNWLVLNSTSATFSGNVAVSNLTSSGYLKLGADNQIISDGSITIDIDVNNNQTDRVFSVRKDNTTELFRVQENGNFGIGTTSPGYKLDIESSGTAANIKSTQSTGLIVQGGGNSTDIAQFKNSAGNTEVVIDTNGNLNVAGNISADNFISVQGVDTGNPSASSEELRLSGYGVLGNRSAMYITNGHSTGTLRFGMGSPGNHGSNTKMTLNHSGDLGIGTTSPSAKLDVNGKISANTGGFEIKTGSYGNLGLKSFYGSLYTTTNIYIGGIGGIPYQSVSASAFNVNSDYRLKSNLAPLEDAVDRVKKLPVHRFNWKDREDEDKVDGFLAHEVSDVVPEAVTGKKDAVREDGTFEYQQIDQSKIVPLLTAALQEAIEKIEQLENRIQTLENN